MTSTQRNDELNQLRTQLKAKITQFIEQGQCAEAEALIAQYESVIPGDPDVYTFKGIIKFIQGDLAAAEATFREGLALDGDHFDLLYNLGYVCDQQGDGRRAARYYKRALKHCAQPELKEQLEQAIGRLTLEGLVEEEAHPQKRVLIVAHIFPPVGGSGVQRTLKFVKYLREFGWEPIVVTVGSTQYPLSDATLLQEIPEEVKIIRVDEPDAANHPSAVAELEQFYHRFINNREIMGEFIRAANAREIGFLYPDPYILWGLQVLRTIPSAIDMEEIDLIYSTSGPYTDHVIGFMLKQQFNKPWIADFRDEWTNNAYANYDKKSINYKVQYAMEERIVREADHLLTTTPLAAQNYIRNFRLDPEKVTTITNGYDEQDFAGLPTGNGSKRQFHIFHNGLLYSIRTPVTFLKAVSNLIHKNQIDKSDLQIGFAWTENDEAWKAVAKKLDLDDIVHFCGYLSHKDSLIRAGQADLLLLIVGAGEKNKAIYPGKIFEYLRLSKPILSLAPHDSLAEQLIEETGRGRNAEFDNVEEIEAALYEMYSEWKNGRSAHLQVDQRVARYERKALTSSLARLFDRVLAEHQEKEKRQKLIFFSIKDGDRFLNDIIDSMSDIYNVRKVIVTDLKQVDEGMKWADICWFEWCDHVLAYGSKLPLAREKKIVCRLHSYEAFTNNAEKVDWRHVDELILVSHSIKRLLESKYPKLFQQVHTQVIPNGVNLKAFEFSDRTRGYNIAFVGYMIPYKNPMMLLQLARKLIDQDPNYKIYIAGEFRDEKLELYWHHQLAELGLQQHVFFEGYQVNMNEWLKDKHYLVSTTMFESFGYGIAEAMACGIKPVIHHFPYSKEIWPEKYLFNTIDEAIALIQSEQYDSAEYRAYIETRFSMEKQIEDTAALLERLALSEARDKTVTQFLYQGETVRFFLPQLEDYIQRTIYQQRQFYEQTMLEFMANQGLRNKVIVDIGANIGNHTVFFAKIGQAKRVYSFEPYLQAFEILERNVELNGIGTVVKPYNIALGDKSGRGTLQVRDASNLGMNQVNPDEEGSIVIRTLDEVLHADGAKRVDMIKIDVEGMALQVLKGALQTIRTHGPILYVEAETEQELAALIKLLGPLGYTAKSRFNATPTYLFVKTS